MGFAWRINYPASRRKIEKGAVWCHIHHICLFFYAQNGNDMETNTATIEERKDVGKGPSGVVTYWNKEIESALQREEEWRKEAKKTITFNHCVSFRCILLFYFYHLFVGFHMKYCLYFLVFSCRNDQPVVWQFMVRTIDNAVFTTTTTTTTCLQ